jgi:hypothetical protein
MSTAAATSPARNNQDGHSVRNREQLQPTARGWPAPNDIRVLRLQRVYRRGTPLRTPKLPRADREAPGRCRAAQLRLDRPAYRGSGGTVPRALSRPSEAAHGDEVKQARRLR